MESDSTEMSIIKSFDRQTITIQIVRITIFSICLFFIITSHEFALSAIPKNGNSESHNNDIGQCIYGIDSWNEMKKQPNHVKYSFYIVSDAVAIAVDFRGGQNTNTRKYNYLQENIWKTSSPFSLPEISSFERIPGRVGDHRDYNHQGFYAEYSSSDYENADFKKRRWELGRDQLLIPAVASAFGLNVSDPKAELIALFAYYTHMLGDVFEGVEASKNQMRGISDYYSLLCSFTKESKVAYDKCGGKNSSTFYSFMKNIEGLKRTITGNNASCIQAYNLIKHSYKTYIPQILRGLGVETRNNGIGGSLYV